MTPKDWNLLAIAEGQSKPLQPVHLRKSLFLLGENLTRSQLQVDQCYTFRAHDYGPFCSEVYFEAEALCGEGLVRIDRPSNPLHQHSCILINEYAHNKRVILTPTTNNLQGECPQKWGEY